MLQDTALRWLNRGLYWTPAGNLPLTRQPTGVHNKKREAYSPSKVSPHQHPFATREWERGLERAIQTRLSCGRKSFSLIPSFQPGPHSQAMTCVPSTTSEDEGWGPRGGPTFRLALSRLGRREKSERHLLLEAWLPADTEIIGTTLGRRGSSSSTELRFLAPGSPPGWTVRRAGQRVKSD